jgi:hypothetical protein
VVEDGPTRQAAVVAQPRGRVGGHGRGVGVDDLVGERFADHRRGAEGRPDQRSCGEPERQLGGDGEVEQRDVPRRAEVDLSERRGRGHERAHQTRGGGTRSRRDGAAPVVADQDGLAGVQVADQLADLVGEGLRVVAGPAALGASEALQVGATTR